MTKSKATELEAVTEESTSPEGNQEPQADGRQLEQLAALRVPFSPDQVDQLPRGRTTLDYVGHAELTRRLLDVDPFWNWEPAALDDLGLPLLDVNDKGQPIGMWIKLTVAGVTRLGYGSCTPGKNDAVKELIGDALRNAGMRFGAALDLWSKSDRAETAKQGGDQGLAAVRADVHKAMESRPSAEPFEAGPTEDLTPLIKPLAQPQRTKLKEWWAEQPFPPGMTAAVVPELYVDRIKAAIERISNGEAPVLGER